MILLIALLGGVGAACRFLVDGLITARLRSGLPVGTLVINICGSFLLGLLTGWSVQGSATAHTVARLAGTGFCGGFTTFSTASVEAVRLSRGRGPLVGVSYAAVSAVAACIAAAFGWWMSTLI